MKRMAHVLAVGSLAATLLVSGPAAAHETDVHIAGFQFGFVIQELPPEVGLARYLSTPSGPVSVAETPSSDDVASVTNHDPVRHTFTECASACDTAQGVPGTLFDHELVPGASLSMSLPPGTYTVMCKVHPWMRGEYHVLGS